MADFASKGVANTGLGLGIAGTALGLLNGAGSVLPAVGSLLSGGNNNQGNVVPVPVPMMGYSGGCCESQRPVTRAEVELQQKLAEKEARIGLLEADKYTDQKIVEVYAQLNSQINNLANEVRQNKDEQYGINLNQAVLNGTTGATIGCIQGQIAALQGLTKLVVPNSSVCPGWGNVTITASGGATTTPTT